MIPTMVTTLVLGPIQNSRILDIRHVEGDVASETDEKPALIAGLLELGPTLRADYPDQTLLLLANIDSNVWDIMLYEDELAEFYRFAFPSLDTIRTTNSKTEFPRLANTFDMSVPTTVSFDLNDGAEAVINQLTSSESDYPWVIKPVYGYGYERLSWPGKAKVYTVHSGDELGELIDMLIEATRDHPRARKFVAQPRVEGNDSYNLSITAYVDSAGKVTMLGSAQVLLEDHAPSALGNPAAMITERYPALYGQVKRFLEGVDWHGFANFDVKVDSRTGHAYFFEVNPRIGRNLYYNTAAGLNPMKFLVDDVIYGKSVECQEIPERIYYSYLPKQLVLRYVDGQMAKKIEYLHRENRVVHPLLNPAERDLSVRAAKREAYIRLSTQKHWLKFRRNFPVEEYRKLGETSFDSAPLRR